MKNWNAIIWEPSKGVFLALSPQSRWKILVVGEHDKGTGQPFPECTLAGQRLRGILRSLALPVAITNMIAHGGSGWQKSDETRLRALSQQSSTLVFLGRRVEQRLLSLFPHGMYLPHPAARSSRHVAMLRRGITELVQQLSATTFTGGSTSVSTRERMPPEPTEAASKPYICGSDSSRAIDVILINSPLKNYDQVQRRHKVTLPVLGMAYIATEATRRGFNVGVLDAEALGLGPARVAALVNELCPRWVGFNLLAPTYALARAIARYLSPPIRVMLGGPHAKALPEMILNDQEWMRIDALVLGEGDTKVSLILGDESAARRLSGVGWRLRTGATALNPASKCDPFAVRDLDSLPFVDRRFLAQDPTVSSDGHIEANLVASRGCPYDCAFCGAARSANPDVGVRYRSSRNLVSEMRMLRSQYGCSRFRFVDDLFLASFQYMAKCFDAFISEANEWRFQWDATGRINILAQADDSLLEQMRRAGCREVALGIESGSSRILRLMDKRISPEMTRTVVTRLLRLGIHVKGYFILGYPSETMSELDETVCLIDELWRCAYNSPGDFRISAFEFRPYPGTPVWRQLLESGKYTLEELLNYKSTTPETGNSADMLTEREEFDFSVNKQFGEVPLGQLRSTLRALMSKQSRRINNNAGMRSRIASAPVSHAPGPTRANLGACESVIARSYSSHRALPVLR